VFSHYVKSAIPNAYAVRYAYRLIISQPTVMI